MTRGRIISETLIERSYCQETRAKSLVSNASIAFGFMAMLAYAPAYASDLRAVGLADLSIEELSNIEITSVSRRPERLADAPASIFVITGEDIRRSGYATLPEVLRLAPNLQVARSSASGYAISARGFNNDNGLANKLLVLIDGRTVYSLSLSGVFWDMQDVMLEDIERIEVISGPGATLWGTNAVNGVINIITRSAKDTQGALIALGAGNLENGAAFRYGNKYGSNGHIRFYGKIDDIDNTTLSNDVSRQDGWERGQVGFRADWNETNQGFTLQGDTYQGKSDDRPVFDAVKVSGTNLLARWNKRLNSGSDVKLQAYYDHTKREDHLLFWDKVDVFDFEFQHGIPFELHKILWGAGYRHARDNSQDSLFFGFVPPSRNLDWVSLFIQDEVQVSKNVGLTLGIRPEKNDYTGWEYLPSARLAWTLSENQLVWGAASRAVRAPARLDRDLFFPPNGLFIRGGPDFESEVADVFELGYRAQPEYTLTYSITGYHHIYNKLRSGQPPPAVVENKMEGTVSGVEAWASYQAATAWRLSGGFTSLHKHLELEADSTDPVGPSALGNDPGRQWLLRSAFDLADRHEFDLIVRHIGSLPQPEVPSYTAIDARWGWVAPEQNVDVSLVLQNIFDSSHVEFGAAPAQSEYERGVFVKFILHI